MTDRISPRAAAAREAARQSSGEFGVQTHTPPERADGFERTSSGRLNRAAGDADYALTRAEQDRARAEVGALAARMATADPHLEHVTLEVVHPYPPATAPILAVTGARTGGRDLADDRDLFQYQGAIDEHAHWLAGQLDDRGATTATLRLDGRYGSLTADTPGGNDGHWTLDCPVDAAEGVAHVARTAHATAVDRLTVLDTLRLADAAPDGGEPASGRLANGDTFTARVARADERRGLVAEGDCQYLVTGPGPDGQPQERLYDSAGDPVGPPRTPGSGRRRG